MQAAASSGEDAPRAAGADDAAPVAGIVRGAAKPGRHRRPDVGDWRVMAQGDPILRHVKWRGPVPALPRSWDVL